MGLLKLASALILLIKKLLKLTDSRIIMVQYEKSEMGGTQVSISKQHVEKAFQEGYFVQAVSDIHSILEMAMNRLLLYDPEFNFKFFESFRREKTRFRNFRGKKTPMLYSIPKERYIAALKELKRRHMISEALYELLKRFNQGRVLVIHKMLRFIPEEEEIKEIYDLGMELWDELWKIEEVKIRLRSEKIKAITKNPPQILQFKDMF